MPKEKDRSQVGRKPLLSAFRLFVIEGSMFSVLASEDFRNLKQVGSCKDFLFSAGPGWILLTQGSGEDGEIHLTSQCMMKGVFWIRQNILFYL